ncbi:MAG: hypothetical protein QG597_3416 [Actinomycetota bacterium]|jgi:hypothetical protein|nr:hypothetical protein [Actinomycetota bacterium]
MSNEGRKSLAVWLLVLAVIAVVVGFIVGKAATDSYKAQPPGMWLAYGAAAVFVIGAIVSWVSTSGESAKPTYVPTPRLVPGWYDDPESPTRLRYWDGERWTDKTADKQN